MAADPAPVTALGLEPGRYLSVIARAEPENSLLEIVSGFSRKPRGVHLAVLGKYDRHNAYHRDVMAAAGDEVRFLGAIYDSTAHFVGHMQQIVLLTRQFRGSVYQFQWTPGSS